MERQESLRALERSVKKDALVSTRAEGFDASRHRQFSEVTVDTSSRHVRDLPARNTTVPLRMVYEALCPNCAAGLPVLVCTGRALNYMHLGNYVGQRQCLAWRLRDVFEPEFGGSEA